MESNFYVIYNTAIIANGNSQVFQCKGFKELLLTLTPGAIAGTLPSLDISVIGYSDLGGAFLLDVFPTILGVSPGNIHLRVNVTGYMSISLTYAVAGVNPSYTTTILGVFTK